jgi:cytochrome c nitrite reductase small subunit
MKIFFTIWVVALLAVVGYGLYMTDFTAYLGNNPSTCNNCHVMDAAYEGWYHGGHKAVAVCGDCHTPHAFIPKYIVKAQSGFRHVSAFLLGHIPDAIRAKETSREVVQENCIRCHEATIALVNEGGLLMDSQLYGETGSDRYCFDCHRSVAHGERGISILPYQHSEENK